MREIASVFQPPRKQSNLHQHSTPPRNKVATSTSPTRSQVDRGSSPLPPEIQSRVQEILSDRREPTSDEFLPYQGQTAINNRPPFSLHSDRSLISIVPLHHIVCHKIFIT
eukprot:scaffold107175_cov44-Cyclotella_meneghiniana.AAC.1